ncbi:type II toxin-antitoxin system PemK/MazF family toxin [Telluribacter sp.]|jgi:mRNA interferase MazF|uniref:type II toxin-antitoxin system PemK/MazF family toxin n=1 Tax=Telluribacter sp. TaxID=1978767 RepID=UPI002E1412A9|nr:type II toxin-antitoxin system PemK/MazF family toxin [Telluribacter sp.]
MKQGEVWLINLDPTVGSEIKKTRPAVIVNDNALGKLPLKVIVPLTDWKDRYDIAPWMVKIIPDKSNNLSKLSAADCFQVRSLSEFRFTKKLGKITTGQQEEIRAGLAKVLSIKE